MVCSLGRWMTCLSSCRLTTSMTLSPSTRNCGHKFDTTTAGCTTEISTMAPIPKRKTSRAPPIDKLMKPAIVVGIAMLAYQFMKGLDSEIPRVDMTDELALREVFFGEGGTGKSYAVLCHEEESTLPISSVFQDAHNDGSSPAEFRIMDCTHTLDSGKTVEERFKLDLKKRPTIFVSGTVGPPKQVTAKHLKTGAMLVKLLRNMLEPRAAKIETTQDLRTKCLDKDICGLILKGSKQVQPYVKDAVANLLKQHPKVEFASVDTSVLFVRNLEEYLPEYQPGQHRFAVFQKVSGGGKTEDRLKTSVVPLETSVSFSSMNALVAGVVSGKATPTKIPSLPVLKTRTKKLEEEERAKRVRRKEQQERAANKQQQSDETFFNKFTENDGSREGRRAERERRRAEHRAQHNVREKTPEEIAEMERKRRIRMEEEAAKWNIAPEDAPPEGDPVGEEIFEEGYEEIVEDADGGDREDEDDEDVMDLD